MSSEQAFPRRAGDDAPAGRQRPGSHAFREVLLRELFEAQERVEALSSEIAAQSANSPASALLLNMSLERFHRRLGHYQLRAADAARHSMAHELPTETLNELREILEHSADFIATDVALPTDPRTVPTGRLPHKNTAELLQHTCSIDFFGARDRLEAALVLLPHLNADGVRTPERYPLLADHLRCGRLDPTEAVLAAKKLEKLRPSINRQPNAHQVAVSIERQIVDSLLTEGPGSTGKLFMLLGHKLDDKPERAPGPQELAAKVGCRVVRRTEHLTEIRICLTNTDAEVFLSVFAQADNPRTQAGNREALAAAARSQSCAATGANALPGDTAGSGKPSSTGGQLDTDGPAAAGNVVPILNRQYPAPETGNSPDCPPLPEWAIEPSTPVDRRPHATWTDLGRRPEPHRANPEPPPMLPQQGPPETVFRPRDTPVTDNGPGSQDFQGSRLETNGYSPAADGLTPAHRRLQALLNILRSAAHPGSRGNPGLPQPRMVVYCQLTTLLGMSETDGVTQHGLSVSPGDLRRELCNAGVIPMVFNGDSQILDVGREQRFIPGYMRQAILARDGGCLVPGCSVPPEHVEMCHVEAFSEGGSTSVFNAGPGCTAHHHAFHTGEYKLVLNDQGLPAVILPKYMDPAQLPRRNSYWQQQHQINPTLF